MTDRAPAPTVTISGGPAPAASRDLLDSGPDHGSDPRRSRLRRTAALFAGAGLLLLTGLASDLHDRRADEAAARAQEQRDRSAVELVLLGDWTGSSSYDPATDRIRYEVRMTVRNDGPRSVQLLAVGLPGVQLGRPVELAAGRERGLALQGLYSCTGRRAAEPAPDSVPVQVRTDAGQRGVELPIPAGLFVADPLAEACRQARLAPPVDSA